MKPLKTNKVFPGNDASVPYPLFVGMAISVCLHE